MATRRGQQPVNDGAAVTIEQLRDRFGRDLSDEDLLLRAVMPAEQVDAMVEARRGGTRKSLALMMNSLGNGRARASVAVRKGDTSLEITRDASAPGSAS